MARPKGSKNASTLLQEAVLAQSETIIMEEFPKIVKAVVAQAKDGDMRAAKMIMDRVIPARKAIEHRQAKGNSGVTIVVQGIAQVEQGKPVLEGEKVELEALDYIEPEYVEQEVEQYEEITNE